MACTAVAIAVLRNLVAVVMLGGIFSLLSAAMFVVLDAVDVAFTEASVGAGISTLLLLAALALTTTQERHPRPAVERRGPHRGPLLPFVVTAVTGAALVYGSLDMASFGDPEATIHRHVAPRYIERTIEETGVPNIVTSVLASYRGYDTLGETTVIFTAGIGVIMLLGSWRRARRRRNKGTRP
jgi:multicomponent Na+:H+ antiporter subunit B